jgi:hypothetical protein
MKATLAILALVAVRLCAQSPCDTPGPIPFSEMGKWGYASGGGVVIPPSFEVALPFTAEGAVACHEERCGLINSSGSFVAQIWDHAASPFPGGYSEGVAPALHDGKWGYLDRDGKVVLPFQYVFAGPFNNGMARVRVGDKFFFIDKLGNQETRAFDGAYDFHEELAAVMIGENVGYIRRDGTFAIPAVNGSASGIDFSEGVAAIRVRGKVGFMDKTGSIVIEPQFDDVYPFSDGLAAVQVGYKWGYVDHSGRIVIPIKFSIGHMFSEGVASVELDAKWEYINRNGGYAIPPVFDSAMPFCGGVALVETFRTISETKGMCRAARIGKHGFVDHQGKYVWRDSEDRTWNSPFCR